MPKRKRDFEPSDGPKSSARQQRIDHKIAQGSIHLAHAFKVAKSFERQKLGRREKTARAAKNDKDVVRIESEIGALKTLDTSLSAHLFLQKTLSRIKAVAASDLFEVYLSTPPASLQDVASQNIYARLCNSKPVKEAIATLLEGLLDAAHIQAHKKNSGRGKGDQLHKTEERLNAKGSDHKGKEEDPSPERADTEILEPQDRVDGSEEEEENDYGDFERRLADSDSDDDPDEEEFESVADLERQLQAEGVQDRDDWSGSEDDDPSMNLDDAAEMSSASDDEKPGNARGIAVVNTARQSFAAKSSALSKPTSSLLLPSLTMGGYISASDGSEAEDIDEKPRKNRPGQRARQAIWEKKYGSKANHLQQDAGSKGRDQGWDMKRGATGSSNRTGRAMRGPPGRLDDSGGANGNMPRKPKKDDSGKLHPSWEAAKVAKEKKAATAAAFAGKKISFD